MGDKKGLGIAIVRGIEHAIKKLNADIIVTNEADGAYETRIIPGMIEKIEEGYDVVIASRHVVDGKTEGWTWHRRLNHFIANTVLASWVAGVSQVGDHNGLLRVVRVKNVQDKLNMNKWPTGFGFLSYWIYKLTTVTDKICEVPATYRFRTRGESKVSFNPKYIKTYIRDVGEYVELSLKIRSERSKV